MEAENNCEKRQAAGQLCGQGYATIGQAIGRAPERPTMRVAADIPADWNFSHALEYAKSGSRIARRGWNAGGQWVQAQYPDKGSKMSQPYLYIKNASNDLLPWVPSQGDIFAQDWAILP